MQSALTWANLDQDISEQVRVHMLMATGEGRFDLPNTNLNDMVAIQTQPFQHWLFDAWAGQF